VKIFEDTGAMVMGRRMFDLGVEPWGTTPYSSCPCSSSPTRRPIIKNGGTTYFSITDGIESALKKARAVATQRTSRSRGRASGSGR